MRMTSSAGSARRLRADPRPPTPSRPRHLSLQQVAQRLGVVPARVERLVISGAFPGAVRRDGVWSIPARDLRRRRMHTPAGLRPIPLPVVQDAGSRFWCVALHGELSAGDCVLRQQRAGKQTTGDTWRGQGAKLASCRRCEQGESIVAIVGPQPMRERYHGVDDGRMAPGQAQARARLMSVGLLQDVPFVDALPEPEEWLA